MGNTLERLSVVNEVDQRGENQHADDEEDNHEEEFLETGFQGVDQDPESRNVPDQPENPENSRHTENRDVVYVAVVSHFRVDRVHDELDVVRNDRQNVDHAHQ